MKWQLLAWLELQHNKNFFFFFFFFSIIKYLLINFLHHLHYRTLIANTNYRTVLTILTIQIVLITILTLTLLIDTITALRKEEQKRWPTYLHSLLINAKTYRPFYLFTFVIRFFFFFFYKMPFLRQTSLLINYNNYLIT